MSFDSIQQKQPPTAMSEPSQNSVLAVILARGGSKGLPGKNLCKVGGVTLVGRAKRTAQAAQCVSTVLVSTDDAAIRQEARAHGAMVVARPAELAGDEISAEAALRHAVETWQAATETTYRAVALLQATSPFTRPADVDRVMDPILDGEADSTVSVVDDHGFFWFDGPDGWSMPYQVRGRRQDRMAWKREAGNVYGMRSLAFLRTGNLFDGRVQAVTIPIASWLDVDTLRDLEIAEAFHASSQGPMKGAA